MGYNSIYDVDVKGKTVFIRVDLNSDIAAGRVIMSPRIREHSKSIYYLSEEGAKTVVLAHQSRPGEDDFISLKRHSIKIKKLIDKPVKFVSWKEDYKKAIKDLKNGEILVLDNTRFLPEELEKKSAEEHSKDKIIQELAPLGDMFVQDALSVCHRKQTSVVGFCSLMPCYVGPCLLKELKALKKLNTIKDSKLYVLGGAKPEDSIPVLKTSLEKGLANEVLIGGLLGELFLKANGVDFGAKEEFFKKKGYLELIPEIKKVIDEFSEKIVLPLDIAVKKGDERAELAVSELPTEYETGDIGKKTIELFKEKIRNSKLTVCNGPMGMYEKQQFSIGTQKILEATAFSKTFSIVGGGDTEKAVATLGLLPSDFNHMSLAGKALLSYLAGEKLPGLEVLKQEQNK